MWSCDLSEARSPAELLATVGATLQIPPTKGSDAAAAAAQIADALAARPPLVLILDTFEQLVEAAGAVVGGWRDQAREATFIVTSRSRLRLEGEAVVEVGPLDDADALALFEERARRLRPSFSRSEDEEALRELVRRLDHNPLAIELAAARVTVLPPRKLLERLATRLDLLRSTRRDGAARHANLRSALDGSWDLLAPWEKQALAQCSVFHGGFTLEAAEAVLRLDAAPEDLAVVDVLEALGEKSLLSRADEAGADARFQLLDTVREYAADKLSADGEEVATTAWRRHAAHYLAEAEAWIERALPPWGAGSSARVAREVDNLLAVARRFEGRDAPTQIRAAVCLDAILVARGPLDTHREVLDGALAVARDADSPLAPRLLAASANAHRLRGQLSEGRAEIERALAAVTSGAPSDAALVHVVQAHLELDAGRLDAARAASARAVDLGRQAGDARLELVALHTLARVHVDADELDAVRRCADAALPLARRLGMALVESQIENQLGIVAARVGRLDAATAHYRAALALARELGDGYLEATIGSNLADVFARRGAREGALEGFEESLALARRMGFRRVQGVVINHLGLLEHDAGNLEAARASHDEAIVIHREVGNVRSEAFGLDIAGLLALDDGRLDDAVAYLDRALELATAHGVTVVAASAGAYRAAALAKRGRHDDALRALEPARAAAATLPRPEATTLVDLHEAVVWVEAARDSLDRKGSGSRADGETIAHVALARRRLEESEPCERDSTRCRIGRRVLEDALARLPATIGGPPSTARSRPSSSARPALEIDPDGRWFRRAGSEPVDLSRRRSLRLLVQRLGQLRLEAPGTALSLSALFEIGWPGEHIGQAAAFRRVYTAIGMLRDFGLRDILVRHDDGYLLSPTALVVARNEKH